MDNILLHDVTAAYGSEPVLESVSLDVGSGLHLLMGINGVGKTTLLRVMAGILAPRSGTVAIRGVSPADTVAARRSIGYVSHRPVLSDNLTVRENLDYWRVVQDVPLAGYRERLAELCEVVGLDVALMQQTARTLSRGQAQKVSLLRALLTNPDILLLDEPTTGLDPASARSLREALMELARRGKNVVMSTHNVFEAEALDPNLIVLYQRHVVAIGSKRQIANGLRLPSAIRFSLASEPASFPDVGRPVRRVGAEWLVPAIEETEVPVVLRRIMGSGLAIARIATEEPRLDSILTSLAGFEASNSETTAN